mmetsp:Transcript_24316/g.37589  ORF Transcript_24316/g.37589 Transcript_24316/m.37589 type:complete len:93 (-) Transcript_24316:62-340(-)
MESKRDSDGQKESCTGGQPSNDSDALLPPPAANRPTGGVQRKVSMRSSNGSFHNNVSRNNMFNWDLNRASMGGDSNPVEHTANFDGSRMTSS